MKELGVVLLMAIIAMGILLIILLQKITILKKQTDEIIKEVKAYVAYVTESEEQSEEITTEKTQKKVSAETQNHIIQAVLGEYFP